MLQFEEHCRVNNVKSKTCYLQVPATWKPPWRRHIQWLKISTIPLELFWLYLAILVATIAFKYTYINEVYIEGIGVAVDSMVDGTSQAARLVQLTLLFHAECSRGVDISRGD